MVSRRATTARPITSPSSSATHSIAVVRSIASWVRAARTIASIRCLPTHAIADGRRPAMTLPSASPIVSTRFVLHTSCIARRV